MKFHRQRSDESDEAFKVRYAAYRREYRLENIDRFKARAKASKKRNPQKPATLKAQRERQWVSRVARETPEQRIVRLARIQRWRQENPDQFALNRRLWHLRRRAREQAVNEKVSARDIRRIFDLYGGRCFKCGSADDLTLDHHRPLKFGHALLPGNAVLLCRRCNGTKHARPPEIFYTPEELEKLDTLLAQC